MSRIVLPKNVKDWLHPILKGKADLVTIEFPEVDVKHIVRYTDEEVITKEKIDIRYFDYIKDPRGFYFESVDKYEVVTELPGTITLFCKDKDIRDRSFVCPSCVKVYLNEFKSEFPNRVNICRNCQYNIPYLATKNDPGWEELKLMTAEESVEIDKKHMFFGFEVEFTIPKVTKSIESTLQEVATTVSTEFNWSIPAFWTRDASLGRIGLELNFYPMTRAYYNENHEKFERFFALLRANGMSYLNDNGTEVAGIHCHINKESITEPCENFVKEFGLQFRSNLLALSDRSEYSYDRWCSGSYKFFAPHTRSNVTGTWEYRAFSSKILVENSKGLEYCMNVVQAIVEIVNDPGQLFNTDIVICGQTLSLRNDPNIRRHMFEILSANAFNEYLVATGKLNDMGDFIHKISKHILFKNIITGEHAVRLYADTNFSITLQHIDNYGNFKFTKTYSVYEEEFCFDPCDLNWKKIDVGIEIPRIEGGLPAYICTKYGINHETL